ncbi:uncharacterized protein [Amphiura filiformis]|uniref:uncharacterized protein n=1 Tax=Amphiura filiformis TaxID=82378 RepID=UPI003B21AD79
MTQGEEQQHSGIASASSAVKDPRTRQPQAVADNGVESTGTSSFGIPSSSSSSSLSYDNEMTMEQISSHFSQSMQQNLHSTSEAGDVRTLLHFVNVASDDIKAALDTTSTTLKSDNGHTLIPDHERRVPENGQISSSTSPTTFSPNEKLDSAFDFRFLGNSVAQTLDNDETTRGKTCAVAPVNVNTEKFDNRETKGYKPDMLIMDVPLKEHLQMSSCIQGDSKVNLDKSLFDKRYGDIGKPHGLITPFLGDKKDGVSDNPVPLRKRRLPASFWQEPGKSENHKTAPTSLSPPNYPSNHGNLSPTSQQSNFKIPMLSPLSPLHYGNESRFGNNLPEKGFLYPGSLNNNSNDSCCAAAGSNLGLSFHYTSTALPVTPCMDSLQHRSMALSCGSPCSCHLNNMNNSNYFYEHHHNHGLYPRSHGEFSSLLNSAAAAAAAAAAASSPSSSLSRWHHHPQSLHSDSHELCHHTIPRVLKPIPTKTVSSYPPRFHPIFT